MLTVIKRSGAKEAFDPNKIRRTLAATSDEAKKPLNAGDLDAIIKEVEDMLEGRESITSRQIYMLVIGALHLLKFHGLAGYYSAALGNAWK